MVKKVSLLLIASIVWLIAGFNVLKIGIEVYGPFTTILNFLGSLVVFAIFWGMIFSKLEKKHVARVMSYEEEKKWFIHFFDVKSFLIMAVMMSGGIFIRVKHLLPLHFIAVFYTETLITSAFYCCFLHRFRKRLVFSRCVIWL